MEDEYPWKGIRLGGSATKSPLVFNAAHLVASSSVSSSQHRFTWLCRLWMIARVGSTRAIEGSSTNTTYLITDGEGEGREGGNKNKIERDKVERKHTWKSPP